MVSVLVPVLDEAAVIRETAAAMLAQRLDDEVEFLFIDGGSSDGTREILAGLAREDDRVVLVDNPRRRVADGLNLGLERATGEYVARMDAHTHYPPDYLAVALDRIRRGEAEWVSGPAVAEADNGRSLAVARALSSPLGVGGATFRRVPDAEVDTDAGFTGMLRRDTLERLGGWNPAWEVNEDGELAARVHEDGGRIVLVPEMAARYVPRSALPALARQYFRYGRYRAKTARHHPSSMRRSHVLAPGLVLATAVALLGRGPLARLARLGLALYAGAVGAESVRLAGGGGPAEAARIAAAFAVMHFAWGAGYLAGSVSFGLPLEALVQTWSPSRSGRGGGAEQLRDPRR